MQSYEPKVYADPVKEHDEEAEDAKECRPIGFMFGDHADVHDDKVHDPGDEGEGFFGVPAPGAAPGLIGPDGAEDDGGARENPEGELQDDEIAGVEGGEHFGGNSGFRFRGQGGFVRRFRDSCVSLIARA